MHNRIYQLQYCSLDYSIVRNWSWFPCDGHVVVTGLWDLCFPYKYNARVHHNNESCTDNYMMLVA